MRSATLASAANAFTERMPQYLTDDEFQRAHADLTDPHRMRRQAEAEAAAQAQRLADVEAERDRLRAEVDALKARPAQ